MRRILWTILLAWGLAAGCATEKLPSDRNRAPVANGGPDLEVEVGERVELDAAKSFDSDGDELSYRWTLTSPAGSTASLDSRNHVMTGFIADRPGRYEVTLIATDGELDSAPDTIRVEAVGAAANQPPVAIVGSGVDVAVDTAVTLDGSGSFDPDNDPLSFVWTVVSAPSGGVATLTAADSATPRFQTAAAGAYVVQLVVSDGALDSEPVTIEITAVADGNRAPIADAGAAISVATGSIAELDGRNSADPEGAALSYIWSLIDAPEGSQAVLSASDIARPSLRTDVDGTYVAQLVVDDGTLQSEPDTVSVIASTGNLAPVAEAGPDLTAWRGDVVALDGGGSSDPDGDPLGFAWSLVAKPAESNASLAGADSVRPTLEPDQPGSYEVSLVVDDGALSSAVDTVTVTVSDPVPSSEGDVVITEYMANPTTVGDDGGEWFEIFNPTNVTWDLQGCVLEDLDVDSHPIGAVRVGPQSYVTFAKSASPGFAPDYVYGNGFPLANGGDEIIVTCGAVEIAQITYASTEPGKSASLLRAKIDEVQNDFDGNWCVSTSNFNGDFGTPGAPNDFDVSCP